MDTTRVRLDGYSPFSLNGNANEYRMSSVPPDFARVRNPRASACVAGEPVQTPSWPGMYVCS